MDVRVFVDCVGMLMLVTVHFNASGTDRRPRTDSDQKELDDELRSG
jgi:hypothetical protein